MSLVSFYKKFYRLCSLRYKVEATGVEHVRKDKTYLMLPNHISFVEPILTFSTLWRTPHRPMATAYLFNIPLVGWCLRHIDAIMVPEMDKKDARSAVAYAHTLKDIAIDTLRGGRNLGIYPSGHVQYKKEYKENIGNRRLAYEVCRELPDGVEVLLVRSRGTEHSITARHKWKPCLFKRRKVHITYCIATEQVKQWAQTLSRREFNEQLEHWYNNDKE